MSGLTTCYQMLNLTGSAFFSCIMVHTGRYDTEENSVVLKPYDPELSSVQSFVDSTLSELGARITTCRGESIDSTRPWLGCKQFVADVTFPGEKGRTVIDLLFIESVIDDDARSYFEDPLQELERCLEFIPHVNTEISVAQKSIIESFLSPYIPILMASMTPEQIKKTIHSATIAVSGFVYPETDFKPVMKTFCPHPYLDKDWSKDKRDEVLDALYMIARVITGKANLETALMQSGPSLPNLKTQKEVVSGLFGFSLEG